MGVALFITICFLLDEKICPFGNGFFDDPRFFFFFSIIQFQWFYHVSIIRLYLWGWKLLK